MENKKSLLPLGSTDPVEFLQKLGDNINSINNKASDFRGAFIHSVTLLETQIDEILTLYFCPKEPLKREELLYALLSTEKMTLFSKYQLLSFIMHRHYKKYYEKHSPQPLKKNKNEIPPPSLDTRVLDVIELRNKFAHRKIIKSFGNTINFDGDNIALDLKKSGKNGEFKKAELKLNKEIMRGYSADILHLLLIFQGLRVLMEIEVKKEKE